MMLRLLALLVPVLGIVTDCNPTSLFRPTLLGLRPDPPISGEIVHLTVQFENPGSDITSGIVTTSVTLNGIPFSPKAEDLCPNTACPIVQGFNDRSTSSTWPGGVSGKIVSKSVWKSSEGEELLCLQTTVKVGSPHLRAGTNISLTDLYRDDISLKRVSTWKNRLSNLWCPAPDFYYMELGIIYQKSLKGCNTNVICIRFTKCDNCIEACSG